VYCPFNPDSREGAQQEHTSTHACDITRARTHTHTHTHIHTHTNTHTRTHRSGAQLLSDAPAVGCTPSPRSWRWWRAAAAATARPVPGPGGTQTPCLQVWVLFFWCSGVDAAQVRGKGLIRVRVRARRAMPVPCPSDWPPSCAMQVAMWW